jgi:aquaporin TIP
VRHWLKKYKSVAYDMEDTLDELVADAMIWENSPSKVRTLTLSTLETGIVHPLILVL